MRIAAGILIIIVGLTTPAIAQTVAEMVAGTTDFEAVGSAGATMVLPVLLLLGLTIGGGFCAVRKKQWRWALSGAICSAFIGFAGLIFVPLGLILFLMGMLAVIFLLKRKGEFDKAE